MRVLATVAATLVALSTLVAPAHAVSVSRQEVINRAKSWLTANAGGPVPYNQAAYWGAERYRQDCSGYVSMAAKLGAPGQRTVELAQSPFSTGIAMSELRWADIVVDPVGDGDTRHVVIFDKWADPYKTAYYAYEQRSTYGTTYRVLRYGLGGDQYVARRLTNVTG
ncbi:hypothetical protein SK803_09650 [Lentzea sp. BCCO 10_0856]|uniref:Uncharacterized protein n=1 Tax=Lentzea miocenica TaxID=3095431 RepID=A0ABU4SXA7_9PSEU|nr:hypothetical protein [Lentzea sp. BCCO 10_0856]MDX8030475.1 hypothetical protein [Lentzea sp. BCCO 10_0856]